MMNPMFSRTLLEGLTGWNPFMDTCHLLEVLGGHLDMDTWTVLQPDAFSSMLVTHQAITAPSKTEHP